jgi:hypothetical protein
MIEAIAIHFETLQPAGFTEWGYLGGLIFIVVAFLIYLIRRDAATAKREKSLQDFFALLFEENKGATANLVKAIGELVEEFKSHDQATRHAIAKMEERTRPKGRGQE